MVLLTLAQTLVMSLVIGVTASVLMNSRPYQWLLSFLNPSISSLLNCRLCGGYWFTLLSLILFLDVTFITAFFFAGLGAYVSEMTDSDINTIQLGHTEDY